MKRLFVLLLLVAFSLCCPENAFSSPALASQPPERATRLTEVEITQRLQFLPDSWSRDGQTLRYRRSFTDFVEAIAFVNSLVAPAEALGHHPDITINYNRVSLELTTHDAGGLTELDFQLAEAIAQL
ncbi:MAG: 4a-hydroxytetrahydrobiopterin dehydratase [Cyanobacteria bacterium P01_A01_bin.135]